MIAANRVRCGVLIFGLLCGAGRLQAQEAGGGDTTYPKLQHINLKAIDKKHAAIHFDSAALHVFVFLSPECPLSQNYTLVLNDLQQKFDKDLKLYAIIPGRAYSEAVVRQFTGDYKLSFPAWIDLKKEFSNYVQATVTPEVVLVNNSGTLVYRGAIDDWVEALGRKKAKATVHYLENAIKAYLQNKDVPVKKTRPVGCLINEF